MLSCSALHGRSTHSSYPQSRVLRFHSWGQGCRAVTPSLPEPLWVEWAAWDDVCAVGSDDGVHVLRATRRSNGDAGSAEGWVVQRVHSVHVPRCVCLGAYVGRRQSHAQRYPSCIHCSLSA